MFRLSLNIARGSLQRSNYRKRCRKSLIQLRSFGVSRYGQGGFDNVGNDDDDENEIFGTDNISPDDMELHQHNPFAVKENTAERETLEEEEERQQKARDEFAARKGRGWSDPWEMTEDDLTCEMELADFPEWSPSNASKLSLDRIKVLEDGIPDIKHISELPLPNPPVSHPSLDKDAYNFHRENLHFKHICGKIPALVDPKLEKIRALKTWEEKQDAVDELFESVEEQLKEGEEILGRQPSFGTWVETGLEKYLEDIQNEDKNTLDEKQSNGDDQAIPLFMDLYDENDAIDSEKEGLVVPKILHPLKPHKKADLVGRMVEEWELAAHGGTRRIMLRQSTREIARIMEKNTSFRVFVNGDSGCGKTAALCSIVASARKSGYIVFYAPDGDRLRRDGYYVEPNSRIPGLFDIPILSQEMCENILLSHKADLTGMNASEETRNKFLDDSLRETLPENYSDDLSLVGLLKLGAENDVFAPTCYSIVIETLMNQEDKPFLVVLDEFNCYYDYGHYFHMDYNADVERVENAIPLDKITLFKPFLDSMGISSNPDEKKENLLPIKRGGIVAAISENRAVARKFTDGLVASAAKEAQANNPSSPMHLVTVPRYSDLEVEHILSNFDVIGIGRLRFDMGDTVIDEQEVSYLRMVSGSNGQQLLEACLI